MLIWGFYYKPSTTFHNKFLSADEFPLQSSRGQQRSRAAKVKRGRRRKAAAAQAEVEEEATAASVPVYTDKCETEVCSAEAGQTQTAGGRRNVKPGSYSPVREGNGRDQVSSFI